MQHLNLIIAIVELNSYEICIKKGLFYRELIARNTYHQYKHKSETCLTYLDITPFVRGKSLYL